jgi:hypothetical protein
MNEALRVPKTKIANLKPIDFTVTGFGDDGSIVSMILMNEGDKCSIAKRLVSKGDGTLAVEEYVDFDFVKHQIKIT